MSPEQQRIAIAELRGYPNPRMGEFNRCYAGELPNLEEVPDYLNDLNAMHEAKQYLLTSFELCNSFQNHLLEERPSQPYAQFETDKWTWGQSASTEAKALLLTIGKWVES